MAAGTSTVGPGPQVTTPTMAAAANTGDPADPSALVDFPGNGRSTRRLTPGADRWSLARPVIGRYPRRRRPDGGGQTLRRRDVAALQWIFVAS